MQQVNCAEKFLQHCDNVKRKGPPSWRSQTAGGFKSSNIMYELQREETNTVYSHLQAQRGDTRPACPSTNVRGSQMQPENTATFLCSVPACRQGLRTPTYTELWGYSATHRCSNLQEDGAWTSLFSSPLHCWTHKHRNIYCMWNAILCLSVLASDRQRERGKVGEETEWVRKCPVKVRAGFSGSILLSSHSLLAVH